MTVDFSGEVSMDRFECAGCYLPRQKYDMARFFGLAVRTLFSIRIVHYILKCISVTDEK